jgi:hypothetical protein
VPHLEKAAQLPQRRAAQRLGRRSRSCWVGLTRYDPTVPPAGIALMTNQVAVSPDATAECGLEKIIALS